MPGDGLGLVPGDGLGLMPGLGDGLMPGEGLGDGPVPVTMMVALALLRASSIWIGAGHAPCKRKRLAGLEVVAIEEAVVYVTDARPITANIVPGDPRSRIDG